MQRPQYGIDAPGLLRFFLMTGAVALGIFGVVWHLSLWPPLQILLTLLAGTAAAYLLGMGCLMTYYSKIEKLKDNQKLLNLIPWSGSEQVLDVGCGRGLMLIGAAKRLTAGQAVGIDLWQQQDQANNRAAATLLNAAIEGVTERITVQTADMRQLPFADGSFDVVVSNWAVHNLEAEADRQTTLDEIIRVLKPNGTVILSDIENQTEYANHFRRRGMANVQLHNNPVRDAVLKAVSFGSFAPSAVLARKAA
jgi:arsenite methyltransferase